MTMKILLNLLLAITSFSVLSQDPHRCSDILEQSPGKQKAAPDLKHVAKDCREYFLYASQTSTSEIKKVMPLACLNELKKQIVNPFLWNNYDQCSKSENNQLAECQTILSFHRSLSIAKVYPQTKNLNQLNDTILLNKVFWMAMEHGNFIYAKDKLQDWILLLDELIQRQPNCYGVYKAKLLGLFYSELFHKENREKELQKVMDSAIVLNRSDALDFKLMRLNHAVLNQQEIENALKENPKSAFAHYMKALFMWKRKQDRAEAKKWLLKANELAPGTDYIKGVLSKIDTAKLDDKIFTLTMNFIF